MLFPYDWKSVIPLWMCGFSISHNHWKLFAQPKTNATFKEVFINCIVFALLMRIVSTIPDISLSKLNKFVLLTRLVAD